MDRDIPGWLGRWLLGNRVEPAGAHDALQRMNRDELTPKDLRTLLLVPLGGLEQTREQVMAYIEARPHLAVSVISVHAQLADLKLPSIDPQPLLIDGILVFRGRATLVIGERTLAGAWHTEASKPALKRACYVSLLRELIADLGAIPAVLESELPAVSIDDVVVDDDESVSGDWLELNAKQFLAVLTDAAEQPTPDKRLVEHTLLRARSGLLDDRMLAVVLFQARSRAWNDVRRAGLRAAQRTKPMLARVLNQYASIRGTSTARFDVRHDDDGLKSARAYVQIDGDWHEFGPCRDVGQAAARQAVRLLTIAQLSGLPDPAHWPDRGGAAPGWLTVCGDQTPLSVVDAASSRQIITRLQWQQEKSAQPPRATATCRWKGARLTASSQGDTLQDARQAVATGLILLVNSYESAPHHQPAPAGVSTAMVSDEGGHGRHANDHVDDVPRAAADTPLTTDPAQAPSPDLTTGRGAAPGAGTFSRELAGLRQISVPDTLTREAVAAAVAAGRDLAFDTTVHPPAAGLVCIDVRPSREPAATVTRRVLGPHEHDWSYPCGRIAPADAIAVLLEEPADGWSASARLWANVIRLGLSMIEQGRVRPTLADTADRRVRYPTWQVGPFDTAQHQAVEHLANELQDQPHVVVSDWVNENLRESLDQVRAVRGMLDAVAGWFVPSPGTRHLYGSVPFTGAVGVEDGGAIAALQRWIDDVSQLGGAGTVGDAQMPSLLVTVKPPDIADAEFTTATLSLCPIPGSPDSAIDAEDVWYQGASWVGLPEGPDLRDRVRRLLRRAGQVLPSFEAMGADPYPVRLTLSAADTAALRGSAAATLGELGIEIRWDKDWAVHLAAEAVVGPATSSVPLTGRLGLAELFDRRWRFTADGQLVSTADLDRLRETELPWILSHNQWILVDDLTREPLRLPAVQVIPRSQGLLDVLDGWATIDGKTFACTPAAGLAALMAALRSTDLDAVIETVHRDSPITLAPHQAIAVAWMLRMNATRFGCLLADEMGLGKTITSIAFHHCTQRAGRDLPTLVICPNEHVARQWEDEIHTRTAIDSVVYWGAQRTLNGLGRDTIVVTTYGVLQQSAEDLAGVRWGLVIADEAQKIKNMGTGAARWVRTIPSVTRVALTGTPLENKPGELWAILDWCNPTLLDTQPQFYARYVRPIIDAPDQRSLARAQERVRRVVRPFVLRRFKDDPELGLKLPAKHERTHLLWLSDEQRGLLEGLENDDRAQMASCAEKATLRMLANRVIHDQRMIVNSPAQWRLRDRDTDVDLSAIEGFDLAAIEAETPKLQRLRQLLEPLRGTDERVLIFTYYRFPALLIRECLHAWGYESGLYLGTVQEKDRRDVVAEFTDGQKQILVATVTTAGIGLDLTRANHVIHFERHWNPAVEAQATDRAHRMGQTRTVHVHYFVTRNSIEDRIAVLLSSKRDQSDWYLPNDKFDFTKLSAAELISLANLKAS